MQVQQFIDHKKRQLGFYVKAFSCRELPYSELNLFIWDTLEEWSHVCVVKNEPYSEQERVFWHMVHLLSYWPEARLLKDDYLQTELSVCVAFLNGCGNFPIDCIGIRP